MFIFLVILSLFAQDTNQWSSQTATDKVCFNNQKLAHKAVGQLSVSTGSGTTQGCTLFAIGPKLFLTATHCLRKDGKVDGRELNGKITATIGGRELKIEKQGSIDRPFEKDGERRLSGEVTVLSLAPGQKGVRDYLKIGTLPPGKNFPIEIKGFPPGKYCIHKCNGETEGRYIKSECDTEKGTSGGPCENKGVAVGVNSLYVESKDGSSRYETVCARLTKTQVDALNILIELSKRER